MSSAKILPNGSVRLTVEALGAQIVSGQWAPDSKLPHEQDLAAAFGVGRNALREAVKVLAGKGLIRTARRYGSRIAKRSDWNAFDADVLAWRLSSLGDYTRFLRDVTELRLCIEPRAAALAALRASEEERVAIVQLAGRMSQVPHSEATQLDTEFHVAILTATHNELMSGFRQPLTVILNTLFETSRMSLKGKFTYDPNPLIHQALALAIQSGREEEAYSLAVAILARARSGVAELASEAGDWWVDDVSLGATPRVDGNQSEPVPGAKARRTSRERS